jgi:glyoxylase-like metal-dependent hydrolase (beta-lactamase superfamily II)
VAHLNKGKASLSYALTSGKETFVFDPSKNVAAYQRFANDCHCKITRTFETHRQADYISGSDRLRREAGAEIMAPQPDFDVARFAYTPVADGDVFTFTDGGPEVRAIHTPGHTPGSTSYLIDNRYLIAGDAVFILSIGRPDLGGKAREWSKILFGTMTDKILKWDRSLIILPGHYMDWREAKNQVFAETLENVIKKNPKSTAWEMRPLSSSLSRRTCALNLRNTPKSAISTPACWKSMKKRRM